jgi:hypothetical protein
MANYVTLSNLFLIDTWPGAVSPYLGIPTGGWDNTTDNFTETAASTPLPGYPVGTKISSYTDNSYCPGNYTMMYLNYHAYSDTNGVVSATDISLSKAFCFHYEGSDAVKYGVDASEVPYYVVTCCYSVAGVADVTRGLPTAIPCATIDAGESSAAQVSGYGDSYGWFWVGGVCPCADATLLQGTGSAENGPDITVDSICGRGPVFGAYSDSVLSLHNCDITNVGDTTSFEAVGNMNVLTNPIGYLCTSAR